MRITAVKPHPVRIATRNQMLVKIETDEGIYGWGESGFIGREIAVAGAVRHFASFLEGRDPMRRGALWQEMYRSQYFEGGRTLTAAISAIDIALHDIAGKKLGVPVYQLLGGRQRDWVPCFATVQNPTIEENIAGAELLQRLGWQAIRLCWADPASDDSLLFEPRHSLGPTAELLIKARERLGRIPVLGVEYHHRLNVSEAASFCQMLPPGTIDFLEEPIRDETPDAYQTLRTMTAIPFAIGEEFSSKWQFLPYIERGLANYARLDVCNIGGFTEAMKVAGWAEAHYIDLMPHNPLGPICVAASAHMGLAVPNFAWLEIRESPTETTGRYDAEVYPVQPELRGNKVFVRDQPGLGIEVDEAALAGEFDFVEPPHLHRADGSHTNA